MRSWRCAAARPAAQFGRVGWRARGGRSLTRCRATSATVPIRPRLKSGRVSRPRQSDRDLRPPSFFTRRFPLQLLQQPREAQNGEPEPEHKRATHTRGLPRCASSGHFSAPFLDSRSEPLRQGDDGGRYLRNAPEPGVLHPAAPPHFMRGACSSGPPLPPGGRPRLPPGGQHGPNPTSPRRRRRRAASYTTGSACAAPRAGRQGRGRVPMGHDTC